MKYLKVMLPMLAFVLAIGMSFAFTANEDPSTDYIIKNGGFESLNMELNCGEGTDPCEVQFQGETQKYQVYDDNRPGTEKEGGSEVIILPQ